jgi:tRNA nucleotidyltransferase (CCA-adding enzyme)
VTLEDDLLRRDLTINAMARDDRGALIDPHGGARDLAAGVLRHVSPAFAEDPLRVLRVARFAARLGFAIAPETMRLMRAIVDSGELATLAAERVWQEVAKGLGEAQPSRMIEALRESGALRALLPEIAALFDDARGPHLLRALDHAAARGFSLPVRYAVLLQRLGAGPAEAGGTARAVRLAEGISARLRAPAEARAVARLAARHRATVHRADTLRPVEWLELFAAADALRRPERLAGLVDACECDALAATDGTGAGAAGYRPRGLVEAALRAVRGVDAGAIATATIAAAAKAGPPAGSEAIAKAVRAARLAALRRWRSGPARPA